MQERYVASTNERTMVFALLAILLSIVILEMTFPSPYTNFWETLRAMVALLTLIVLLHWVGHIEGFDKGYDLGLKEGYKKAYNGSE